MRYQDFVHLLAAKAAATGTDRAYVSSLAKQCLQDDARARSMTDGQAFRLLYATAYAVKTEDR